MARDKDKVDTNNFNLLLEEFFVEKKTVTKAELSNTHVGRRSELINEN